jgi:hypothetical protein
MGVAALSDDPRPEVAPETAPPAQRAGIGKRRLLIKAALIGSTVPVVMTLSQSAFAAACTGTGNYTLVGVVLSRGKNVSRCHNSFG